MTSLMLLVFYFGLVFSCVTAVCTEDMQQSCMKTLYPVTSFLRLLSTISEKNGGIKAEVLAPTEEFGDPCVPFSGNGIFEFGKCYSGLLLEMFDVKLNAQQDFIKLQVERHGSIEDKEGLRKLCCNWLPTLCPRLCEQCNANEHGQETTTDVITSKVTSKITKLDGINQEETLQECNKTTIVIASILSFLGGALTTFCIVCLFKCVSKRKAKTNTDRNGDEMLVVGNDNTPIKPTTYEVPTTDQPSLDQAYLTLETNLELNHRHGRETTRTNTSLTKVVGNHKQSQIYEQTIAEETDFHVYNTLKSDGTQNPYENADKHDKAQYKNIELENRSSDSKLSVIQHEPEQELQEQPGEDNNYFLLEKEAEQTNNEKVEIHDENAQKKNDAQDDDPSAIDHAYFKLEKKGSFNKCIVQEVSDGQDESSGAVTGSTDGYAYFKLEKV